MSINRGPNCTLFNTTRHSLFDHSHCKNLDSFEENGFSGQVPSQLGQLTKLKVRRHDFIVASSAEKSLIDVCPVISFQLLHLHDNNLSGMSTAICKLKEGFVLSDLTADCEDTACTCCTCNP